MRSIDRKTARCKSRNLEPPARLENCPNTLGNARQGRPRGRFFDKRRWIQRRNGSARRGLARLGSTRRAAPSVSRAEYFTPPGKGISTVCQRTIRLATSDLPNFFSSCSIYSFSILFTLLYFPILQTRGSFKIDVLSSSSYIGQFQSQLKIHCLVSDIFKN